MGESTGIKWTDSTFNPWIGCTKVGPGCDHCYAEALMDHRMARARWGVGQARVRTSAAYWKQPLLWERDHEAFERAHGHRRRVFCASLADVFDSEVDPSWRVDLLGLIHATPHLDWLLLTKRIGNCSSMIDAAVPDDRQRSGRFAVDFPNVWIGATVVNQKELDRDVTKLTSIDVSVRFLSIEPMLGPIALSWLALKRIGWVIVGGESGAGARRMSIEWARGIRDQCAAAGVPFFFKQWGGIRADSGGDVLDSRRHHDWPNV